MEEEKILDLNDLIHLMRKRLKFIILTALICTFAAGIISFFVIKPTYEVSASIIIGDKKESTQKTMNQSDVLMYQNLVKTYAQIAESDSVAEKTSNELKGKFTAESIQKMINVTPQQGTQILDIKVDAKNQSDAVNVLNAVSSTFISESKRVFPTGGDIQIMDKSSYPEHPVKPKKALNMLIAFIIGLIGSIGVSFILEYMDNTLKTEEDISRYLQLPVIGIIPKNLEGENK